MNGLTAPPCCPPLTRREARREERREAILDVATQSFLEHGYAGTTMSGIAAALGGSKGTLWNYYASKELLFSDVLERATREFREQLSLALNPDEPVEVALHSFCSRYLERLTLPEGIALHRLVMGEVVRFPEVGRIFYERAPLGVQRLLSEFLDQAMERGDLRRADPFDAAQFLTALCMARSHVKMLAGVIPVLEASQAEADARAALEVFLRAYA
ncbi:TetR/AcrR family transcriptional regulator [Novosphingobium bradum]|uniref:TetR/AcrR family transcriptional regulator n=1 Tax=Novosphingobium bradum TaxID=1737444 RepID=A0ABV7IMA6_9SPHN